jgi:hypothetical protein
MNTWFHVLERSVDLETISPGGALHRIVGDRMSYRILQGLDDPSSFDGRKIHEGTDALAELLGIPNSDSVMRDNPRITLIDRQSSDSFYHSTQSETHMSGSERRSTPNLRHIDWRAHTNFDVRVVDFARLDPQAQIRTMRNTNVLIGQHGAGLLHMIWMKPGSAVVEIEPPLPPEVRGIFHRLAHCLGHRYEKIAQQSVHADIDPRIIATTLRRVVAEA